MKTLAFTRRPDSGTIDIAQAFRNIPRGMHDYLQAALNTFLPCVTIMGQHTFFRWKISRRPLTEPSLILCLLVFEVPACRLISASCMSYFVQLPSRL